MYSYRIVVPYINLFVVLLRMFFHQVVSHLCSMLYRYLEMLLEYLQDYTERVKPLLDQNDLYGKILGEFEKKWEMGTFPGWPVSVQDGEEDYYSDGLYGSFTFLFSSSVIERDEQCSDPRRSSFRPFCFLFLGGVGFPGSGQVEVCPYGPGPEMWRVSN